MIITFDTEIISPQFDCSMDFPGAQNHLLESYRSGPWELRFKTLDTETMHVRSYVFHAVHATRQDTQFGHEIATFTRGMNVSMSDRRMLLEMREQIDRALKVV